MIYDIKKVMYNITTECSFEELYRYTTTVMCGGYNTHNELLYVTSDQDAATKGEEFTLPQMISLEANSSDFLRVLIYVIPHTMPENTRVGADDFFDLKVTVTRQGESIYNKSHQVNIWGGEAIEIKL